MTDNWQDSPAMKRAAFIGMIGNEALPPVDRVRMAQQVIAELETAVRDAEKTLRKLETAHKDKGLFAAALAYLGAAEVVAAIGCGEEDEAS